MSIENMPHEKIKTVLQFIAELDLDAPETSPALSAAYETLRTYSLAAIALELHEFREQGLAPVVPPCSDGPGHSWHPLPEPSGLQTCIRCGLVWKTHEPPVPVERAEGIPHGTARDSADAQFDGGSRVVMAPASSPYTLTSVPDANAGTFVEHSRHGRIIGTAKVIDREGTLAEPLRMEPGDAIRFEPTP